jgi:Allene oxide cyclase
MAAGGKAMLRRTGTAALLVALTLIVGATVVSAEPVSRGKTLTVVERATTDTVVDLGAAGDTIGDMLAFGNDVYNAANTTKVGRDEGVCFRTNPGLAWECTYTTILTGGSITVQGPFYDDLHDSQLSITGGTGAYANARGQLTLHARNELGSEFDFIYHIIG